MGKQIVTIKLEPQLVKKIEKIASEQNRTRSNYIETVLRKEIKK